MQKRLGEGRVGKGGEGEGEVDEERGNGEVGERGEGRAVLSASCSAVTTALFSAQVLFASSHCP